MAEIARGQQFPGWLARNARNTRRFSGASSFALRGATYPQQSGDFATAWNDWYFPAAAAPPGGFLSIPQSDTITLSGTGPQNYALSTPVDRTKCWLNVQFTSEGDSGDVGQCFAEINAAGTHITVGRYAVGGTYSVECSYQIIEHESITTQWFHPNYVSTTTLPQAIAAVSDRAVIVMTGINTQDNRNRWTYPRLTRTSSTNVNIITEDSPGTAFDVYFHVVDFGADLVASVTYYDISPPSLNNNYDHGIPAVDFTKALLIPTGMTSGAYSGIVSEEIATFGLTSGSNINFKSNNQLGGQTYGVQVVEFVDMLVEHDMVTTTGLTPTITLGAAPTYGGIILGSAHGRASVPSAFEEFAEESFIAELVGDTWTLTRNAAVYQARIYHSTFDFNDLAGSGGTAIVANDLEVSTELSTPTVGQIHAITANGLASASELSSPAVAQIQALTANDLQSSAELSSPSVAQSHAMTANSLQSSSELSTPTLGQIHAITVNSLAASTELSRPAITQVQALSANGLAASSELSQPAVTQIHAVTGNGLASSTELSSPSVAQVHVISATSLAAASELSQPSVTQVHAITASGIAASSELSRPTVTTGSGIEANDLEIATELSSPAVGQIHVISASGLEASAELSRPSVGQSHALAGNGLAVSTELSAPAIAQAHALTANNLSAATELSSPAIAQIHAITANSLASASELSRPTVTLGSTILANDLEVSTELSRPSVNQVHVLTPNSLATSTELSRPAITQVQVIAADSITAASELSRPSVTQISAITALGLSSGTEVSAPTIAQVHVVAANDISSQATVTTPAVAQIHLVTANGISSASTLSRPTVQVYDGIPVGLSAANSSVSVNQKAYSSTQTQKNYSVAINQ